MSGHVVACTTTAVAFTYESQVLCCPTFNKVFLAARTDNSRRHIDLSSLKGRSPRNQLEVVDRTAER